MTESHISAELIEATKAEFAASGDEQTEWVIRASYGGSDAVRVWHPTGPLLRWRRDDGITVYSWNEPDGSSAAVSLNRNRANFIEVWTRQVSDE